MHDGRRSIQSEGRGGQDYYLPECYVCSGYGATLPHCPGYGSASPLESGLWYQGCAAGCRNGIIFHTPDAVGKTAARQPGGLPLPPETSAAPGRQTTRSGQRACPARRAAQGPRRAVTSSQHSHLAKLRHTKPGVHETRDAPNTSGRMCRCSQS